MKKNYLTVLTISLLAANVGPLLHNALGGLLALAFFIVAPGFITLNKFKHGALEPWTTFSFSFGLSLMYLMVGGLLLNSLYFMGIDKPLTPSHILLFFDLLSVGLLWFARRELASRQLQQITMLQRGHLLIVALLALLPLFGALGAVRLNNGASNSLTLISFGAIATLFIVLLRRKRLSNLYPFAVFSFGLTVLLALSIRSWYVSGHDVIHEFYLFNQVSTHGFWSNALSFPGDTYNACMSITVLPTVFAGLTHISNEYVFKLVMQIIFALGLIPLYLLAKKLSNARQAFMVSLLFIAFPTFVNDMPFLVRQEIAFIFFAVMLLAAFTKLSRRMMTGLVVFFMLGMILSHYSSGYVALGILFVAWAIYGIVRRVAKTGSSFYSPLLSMPILIVALLFTFLWNAQITATTGTLKTTLVSSITGLFKGSDMRSNGVRYSLVSGSTEDPAKVLADYAGDKHDLVKLTPEKDMPATEVGHYLGGTKVLHTFNTIVRGLSAKLLQVLLLVGIAYFFISRRKQAAQESVYFYSLAVGCIVMMALITILPQLSVDYGLTRLFLQTMVIVGVPIILGLELFAGLFYRFRSFITVSFVALFFLHLTGFLPAILGGYPPQLTLSNTGTYYDIYYQHKGERLALQALNDGRYGDKVSADKYAIGRIYGNIKFGPVQDPVTTKQNTDYLFNDYANTHKHTYAAFLQGDILEYTFNDNSDRSLMYSNGDSQIYRRDAIQSKESSGDYAR